MSQASCIFNLCYPSMEFENCLEDLQGNCKGSSSPSYATEPGISERDSESLSLVSLMSLVSSAFWASSFHVSYRSGVQESSYMYFVRTDIPG